MLDLTLALGGFAAWTVIAGTLGYLLRIVHVNRRVRASIRERARQTALEHAKARRKQAAVNARRTDLHA